MYAATSSGMSAVVFGFSVLHVHVHVHVHVPAKLTKALTGSEFLSLLE